MKNKMLSQGDLEKKFQNQTPVFREILKIFAIAYEPQTQTDMLRILKKCDIQDEKGKKITQNVFKKYRERLLKTGLLVFTQSYYSPRLSCNPILTNKLAYISWKDGTFEQYAQAIETALPLVRETQWGYRHPPENFSRLMRDMRLAIYKNDIEAINNLLSLGSKNFPREMADVLIFEEHCTNPFIPEWFGTLHPEIQKIAMVEIFYSAVVNFDALEEYVEFWQNTAANSPEPVLRSLFNEFLLINHVIRGEIDRANSILEVKKKDETEALSKILLLILDARFETALDLYESFITILKKRNKKQNMAIIHFCGLFYPMTVMKVKPADYAKRLKRYQSAALRQKNPLAGVFGALNVTRDIALGEPGKAQLELDEALRNPPNELAQLFGCLECYWHFIEKLPAFRKQMITAMQRAKKNGYFWFALEYAILLKKITDNKQESARYQKMIDELSARIPFQPMAEWFPPVEPWERKLAALVDLNRQKSTTTSDFRLVWMLGLTEDIHSVTIQPKEQKMNKSGNWTAGRNVALKRLAAGQVEGMTRQDYQAAAAIYREDRYYGNTYYYFDPDLALKALAGHPLLFLANSPRTPVELIKEEPTLLIDERNEKFELKFAEVFFQTGIKLVKETPTRYRILIVEDAHLKIQQLLDFQALTVPKAAKKQLLQAIGSVSKVVTVHSGLADANVEIPMVDADATIHLHLLSFGDGFRLDMLVRPFSTAGPYYRPGHKGEHLIAEIDGQRLQTRRNLQLEKEKAAEILQACPVLQLGDDGSFEWVFDSPEECLEALLELEAVRDATVIEWPEGEKLRINRKVSLEQVSLRIKKENDWFSMNGEMKIDDNKVIQMKQLLALIKKTSSRFVEISAGQFIALTQKFRKQLDEISAFTESAKSGLRFSPLLAPIMQEFAEEAADLRLDNAWQETLDRLKSIDTLRPRLPSTLQAELRDYQVEGFKWLSRLAAWGVGACLADDMGLGKTLQALAMILKHAKTGPALVVAPASVSTNWIAESHRFAPTLNTHLFGGKDRQETLDKLGGFDLLVCSYGLLPQEIDRLKEINWSIIVLDEAQAIKNAATKRSKAAMQLNGGFKILTTGTPVENHLGELWNLFRFINPGLLGSMQKFNEKFAAPIERYHDADARRRLRRLIQPFILRRIKSAVLDELPPKTEITLTVELTDPERAFYEALRQKALERISATDAPTQDKRFQILAEIMRLRRACCHTRLILPESPIPSSKLALFGEVVAELLENKHKALVFSQFVGHLEVIREYLDSQKISYQYLDGSTPTKKRPEIVNAFQSGDGELFLISLRAGGQGLNLTAADYVIHMDPWWNPAVEDQASDRSHRIGQQRPVTIYRLVTKDTIEEKILALHHSKRDLADSLLEGSDVSGKISAADLLKIIRES